MQIHNKSKISIIIAVYNMGKYLKECLDSVINQTLKDIEIICINDGSTDSSLEILNEYAAKDNRIKIIDQENQGLATSRNNALKIATGQYIQFVDSDDILELNTCETLYNKCLKYDLDMLSFAGNNFNNETREEEYNSYYNFEYLPKDWNREYFNYLDVKDFLHRMSVSSCLTIYKKELLDQYNITFPDDIFFEDNIFFLKSIINAKRVGIEKQRLYRRRIHSASITQNRDVYFSDSIKITDLVLTFLKNIKIDNNIYTNYKSKYINHCEKLFITFKKDIQSKYKKELHSLLSKYEVEYKGIERLFSIKNSLNKKHKVITILGFKIKIKKEKLKRVLFFGNEPSTNGKWYKVICILGMKFSFRNKRKEKRVAIEQEKQFIKDSLNNLVKQNNELKNEMKSKIEWLKKDYLNRIDDNITKKIKRSTKQPILKSIAYHVVNHCNLKCKGCDHFAPLADEKFSDLFDFENDIRRFAELSNATLEIFKLMGGEPLLHHQINEFMRIARTYLPNTRIEIVTNGILLNYQKEDFWNCAKENNIVIVPTKYPIKLDYEKIEKTAQKFHVKLEYYGNTNEVLKTSYHIPLDIEGKQDSVCNFLNCFHANNCVFLKNGKLYPCTVAPNIEHFNKYFNKNIPLTNRDGIDIYKVKSIDEILEFLSKPIPFCKYCNVTGRTFNHKWGTSKKQIEEWT